MTEDQLVAILATGALGWTLAIYYWSKAKDYSSLPDSWYCCPICGIHCSKMLNNTCK